VTATAPPGTNQHYDQDPRIFSLFLDPSHKYSSALYGSPEESLADAQQRKLHFVAGQLGLQGGERLLDLGCGWGSLVLFMAREYGVSAVGVSPAPRQLAHIAEQAAAQGVADRVRTVHSRVEELDLAETFDAVTMLGSIVHMPDLDAVFALCRDRLRRGGRLYVSESCFRNEAIRARFAERSGTAYVRDDIFGGGDMRPLSHLVRAAEDAGFSLVGLTDLTAHYHRTIEDWLANVHANADRLEAIEPGLPDRLARYLETANAGWGYTTKHYALTCQRSR
jgi:cyclopropane-fatty-acyl-phospholipid synthase